MRYKYQLIILGTKTPIIGDIIGLFNKRLDELKLPNNSVKVIDTDNFEDEYLGNQPAFVFYIGDINGDFKDLDITQRLLKDGTMILPIYFNDNSFSKEIPSILENQNGIQYKK